MTTTDKPTLALRKLLRLLRRGDGRMRRNWWDPIWNEATIEAGIRRGLLEPTEHGKYRGKHRPIAVRITAKGRSYLELSAVPRAAPAPGDGGER